jgi:hypothetical protein
LARTGLTATARLSRREAPRSIGEGDPIEAALVKGVREIVPANGGVCSS